MSAIEALRDRIAAIEGRPRRTNAVLPFGIAAVDARLPGGEILKAATVNAARASAEPLGYEEEVWLTFAPDAGVVLPE